MSRLPFPTSIADAPTASQPALNAVQQSLGSVPNLIRAIAPSPAALDGYLALSSSLKATALPAATHERIALAVAELNGCDYCLSAHTYLARHVARLDDAEIAANRQGASNDPRADAAVRFATALVRERGHVTDAQLGAIRAAGYSAAEIVEIVQLVALNTFTNYLNEVVQTPIDFPRVRVRAQAA